MGRWAQARKRGSRASGYLLPPPGLQDWHWEQPGGSGLNINAVRDAPFPPGAVLWQLDNFVNGVPQGTTINVGPVVPFGIFAPGTVLFARMQWMIAVGVPASEYGPGQFYTAI